MTLKFTHVIEVSIVYFFLSLSSMPLYGHTTKYYSFNADGHWTCFQFFKLLSGAGQVPQRLHRTQECANQGRCQTKAAWHTVLPTQLPPTAKVLSHTQDLSRSGFKFYLHCLLTAWPWGEINGFFCATHFLICRMGIMIYLPQLAIVRLYKVAYVRFWDWNKNA